MSHLENFCRWGSSTTKLGLMKEVIKRDWRNENRRYDCGSISCTFCQGMAKTACIMYGREVPSVCPNKLSLYLILQTYKQELCRYFDNSFILSPWIQKQLQQYSMWRHYSLSVGSEVRTFWHLCSCDSGETNGTAHKSFDSSSKIHKIVSNRILNHHRSPSSKCHGAGSGLCHKKC